MHALCKQTPDNHYFMTPCEQYVFSHTKLRILFINLMHPGLVRVRVNQMFRFNLHLTLKYSNTGIFL